MPERVPNVAIFLDRAKSCATNMWLLLHSRQCTDPLCLVLRCRETKHLFELSRAVQIGADASTSQVEAIVQARKLLCHFKECSEARAKSTLHVCLLCSLVSRARPVPNESQKCVTLDFSNSPYDVSGLRRATEVPLNLLTLCLCDSCPFLLLRGACLRTGIIRAIVADLALLAPETINWKVRFGMNRRSVIRPSIGLQLFVSLKIRSNSGRLFFRPLAGAIQGS
jgi:hypothetical protein